jgi:putative hemolysin
VRRPLIGWVVCCALAAIVLLPARWPAEASSAATLSGEGEAANLGPAAEYCIKKGGEVDERTPYYNTNDDNPQNWFRLSGSKLFCKFTSKNGGSRIHVLLSTLYSDQPTLAALAYYAKVPFAGSCNGNPASCYCTQLGGSDQFGGVTPNGGGWVQKSDPVDTVLEACILPDFSSIDSWGLTYHQAGIVRGKNLNGVLRYPDPYAK